MSHGSIFIVFLKVYGPLQMMRTLLLKNKQFKWEKWCSLLFCFWVHWFYIIDILPEGQIFNSSYFIDYILKPLSLKRSTICVQTDKKLLWLHLDNCRVHNSKSATESLRMLGFKRAPHPPYSPDLAPSDFYLFGYIKEKLKGCFFDTIEELKAKIILILEEISEAKRNEVFLSWIKRCDYVASHEGSYYKE